MTNFTRNSLNFTTATGLYRVWVPLRDDGKCPLISIWIDPSLRAFNSSAEEKTEELVTGERFVAADTVDSAAGADSEDTDPVLPPGARCARRQAAVTAVRN